MKTTLLTILAILSIQTNAACISGNQKLEVHLSNKTFSDSYNDEAVSLTENDKVIFEIDGDKTEFEMGEFSNDSAGNFMIQAISSEKATYIEIEHNHESYREGLDGFVTLNDNRIIDLDSFKDCSFNDLFIIQ